jgi:pimeloyl-ACP methyl ester carboxylesterase
MDIELKNATYVGASGKESLYDLSFPHAFNGQVILFIHGYMGFKDWGCWDLVADYFLSKGFGFVKFNISHNGTSTHDPLNFVDLNAFAENSYYKELLDIRSMIDIVNAKFPSKGEINLIGHSRGGGMALIAGIDERIHKIVSWAGISSIAKRFPNGEELAKWQNEGVKFVHNSRTKQDLPLNFSQYEEFKSHIDELSIEQSCKYLRKPVAIFHGTNDESVAISEGMELATMLNVPLIKIEGANHTFNATHPWNESTLPSALFELCEGTNDFLLTNSSVS